MRIATLFVVGFALLAGGKAIASPWAQAGDAQLRSDIEILATAHLLDDVTTHWPLPWPGILAQLSHESLDGQPAFVRNAAKRVIARGRAEMETGELHAMASLDYTNLPSVVRGFDALGRQSGQIGASVEYLFDTTAINISVGAQTASRYDGETLVLDGSYIAQRVGNAVVYAGYQSHWWGPGWISALALSNNARPFPQVGISRLDTRPFEWPVLDWLGPWQAEMIVGELDSDALKPIYVGERITFNPLPGLEIGAGRQDLMCGEGRPCKPITALLVTTNNKTNPDLNSNAEAMLDIRYTGTLGLLPYSVYVQEMNEHESNPLPQSVSHLYGGTVWLPTAENSLRLTLEYANTIPTYQLWGDGESQGEAYNESFYPDGFRYRGHTLGFSLDSDSQLLTLQGNWTDGANRSYTLTLDHAAISDPRGVTGVFGTNYYNVVTTAPVLINMAEGRFTLPWHSWKIDIAGRVQDDQPRPDHGFAAAVEIALKKAL